MESEARAKAVGLLRAAADILEEEAEELILPGWDVENEGLDVFGGAEHAARCAGTREAAADILGKGRPADGGVEVRLYNLGNLVRYIGDMLEE
ncbi:MAG: hypothetical protein J7M19_03285 [Planctomycetes bacterium]|nr:hypothetical protein [Planctomycetota bacterium]